MEGEQHELECVHVREDGERNYNLQDGSEASSNLSSIERDLVQLGRGNAGKNIMHYALCCELSGDFEEASCSEI